MEAILNGIHYNIGLKHPKAGKRTTDTCWLVRHIPVEEDDAPDNDFDDMYRYLHYFQLSG